MCSRDSQCVYGQGSRTACYSNPEKYDGNEFTQDFNVNFEGAFEGRF